MSTLKVEDEKMIVEPEETRGDLDKMQAVFEKKELNFTNGPAKKIHSIT
jgi:hypothetical protein